MKKLILCLIVLVPVVSFAQDAGVLTADAGVAASAGDPAATSSLDNPLAYVKVIYQAVAHGDWWAVAAAFLVLVVSLLRKYGKWLHEKIPDTNPLDKIFWFLLETKPGGWLLNLLTAVSGGVGTSLLVGEKMTWGLLQPILLVSVTGASLWELIKDISEYVQSVKAKNAEPAAPAAPAVPEVPAAPAVPVEPPKP
jgi:hypothetical protein